MAVAAAEILPMHPAAECTLTADYGFYGKLQNLLPQYGAVTLDTAFEGDVTVRFMLRQEQLPPFTKALEEQSAGSLASTVLAEKSKSLQCRRAVGRVGAAGRPPQALPFRIRPP